MLIPVLPLISRELGITSFQASLIITVYALVAIVLIPVAGFLSDRFGRKTVIVPSLILAGLGGAVSAAAALWLDEPAYPVLLVGRFLQGIGAAGAFPIVLPLIGDMFKNEDEVSHDLGVVETSNTFGKVLSPVSPVRSRYFEAKGEMAGCHFCSGLPVYVFAVRGFVLSVRYIGE